MSARVLASTSLIVLTLGCASPQTSGNPGGAGSGGPQGSAGAGSTGTAGTGSQGTAGSGSQGTAGAQGTGGTGGTGAPACTPNPTQLVSPSGWNCNLSDPIKIQGSIYAYGDGSSCTVPSSGNPCGAGGCCISGTTVVDTTFAKWGCGIGMELHSSGGTNPTKMVYSGTAKCFDIKLSGSSGGNVVRIGFTQSPMPAAGAVAPFTEIPPFTNGWMGQVCFRDVNCPSWATMAGTCTKTVGSDGTPVDMQIQISAGSTPTTVGAYNVCVTSIVPVTGGSTGTGGTGGGTNSCPTPSGQGTLTARYADAMVGCPKPYVVQQNDWGSSAGQSMTYGPGTKFKITAQNGTGANGAPASYPSIFTGRYNNRGTSTADSGLPRAISQITAGSLQTALTWADNGATGSYNASYDVWFSTTSAGDPGASSPSGGFLMVWFYDPPDNQPIGTAIPNGTVTIGGRQFNIWYGMNGSRPCVSYVAQQRIDSWTFSLGDFIRDAVGRNCSGSTPCLQSSWYLSTVFAGFEIWRGGTGLEVKDFGITVP